MPGLSNSGEYDPDHTSSPGSLGPSANPQLNPANLPDRSTFNEHTNLDNFDSGTSRLSYKAHQKILEQGSPIWVELASKVQHHQLEHQWNDELCLIVLSKLPDLLKTADQIDNLNQALNTRITRSQSLEDILIAAFCFARANILPAAQDLENLAHFREQVKLYCKNSLGNMLDVCEADGPGIAVGQRAEEMFDFSVRLMAEIDRSPDLWCIKPESISLHAARFNRIARDRLDFELMKSTMASAERFENSAKKVYEQTLLLCEHLHPLSDSLRQTIFKSLQEALAELVDTRKAGYLSEELLRGTRHLINQGSSLNLILLFQEGLKIFARQENPPSITQWYQVVSALSEDNIHQQLEHNLAELLRQGRLQDSFNFKELAQEIAAHALISSIGRNQIREGSSIAQLRDLTERSYITAARRIFGRLSRVASSHLAQEDLQLDPAQRFQLERMLRHYELHHGFGSLLHECRRLPDGSPALFERFALDIGRVSSIRWSSKGNFPESGFLVDNLETAKFLVSDPRTPGNPFHHYKHAWPLYRNEIDLLKDAQFILSRGFIAILPPDRDPRAWLEIEPNHKVQFSLVVFNDHFKNPETRVAYLVETRALRELISNPRTMPDSIDQLISLCSKNVAAINVGQAGSVTQMVEISGGMKEIHREQRRKTFELLRKYRDERHPVLNILPLPNFLKTFLKDTSQNRTEHSIELSIKKLQQLEHDIRQQTVSASSLALICHNYFDLMRIAYSNWKKGQTLSTIPKQSKQTGESTISADSNTNTTEIFMSSEEAHTRAQALLMLQEAYRWHHLGHAHNLPATEFPVIKVSNPLSYWDAPLDEMALDTFDLSLRIGRAHTQLSRSPHGPSGADKVEWALSIMSIAADRPNQFRTFCLSSRDILESMLPYQETKNEFDS